MNRTKYDTWRSITVLNFFSLPYRAIIVLPCLVIMLMTGCSFLLTPTSGEKLIINAIALLASILYLLYFAMTLPFTQNDVPIIGK